ncbi:MAG: DUF1015 family protein [Terrisporobacter sp.]|uniref:DUF1015 domain-containing protein n=1 Tax=Terrisporobacter sp. TaxID=1965305 RepID=UPI002FC81537
MAIIKPFKAIRPANEYVNMVAELPYDVMNREEAKKIAKDNQYSFLHVDRAEIDLDDEINEHDEKVYLKANENLQNLIDKKILIKDKKEAFYIYREIVENKSQIGIVACVSVDDDLNGVIKKHEYTKPDKELDRTNHIKYCNANTGTILLTYKNKVEIEDIMNYYVYHMKPLYDFISEDNVIHTIWKVEKERDVNDLIKGFGKIENLYVADGHHRCAAAKNVALEKRKENTNYTGEEEFNYFTAMIAPDTNLKVMDYNRVIKDLNGLNEDEFLGKIKEKFIVKEAPNNYKPNKKGQLGMYLNKKWYIIEFGKEYIENNDVVESLDISILQKYILDEVLGIKNPRVDKRIDFIGGIRGSKEIEKRVNEDMKVGFLMYPTTIEELIDVADANKIMPAKSTWFEPKVRCGIFVHEIL